MKNDELLDRQMNAIRMDCDYHKVKKVIIGFNDNVEVKPIEGQDHSRSKKSKYGVNSDHEPHVDFANAMKVLLDPVLSAIGMNITASDKNDYAVMGVFIKGNLELNQARVSFIIGKRVHNEEKVMKIGPTPPVLLSDEAKFLGWKDLKKKIQTLEKEAYGYISGKHADDKVKLAFDLQMSLFPEDENESGEVKEEKTVQKKATRRKEKDIVIPDAAIMGAPAVA